MATLHAQRPTVLPTTIASTTTAEAAPAKRHDVDAIMNYFQPNADGSPPAPAYIDRPETAVRPVDAHTMHITDITGSEAEFSLDKQGFQIVPHIAQEKDFLDDEHIKAVYYPETEQLLKDVTGASKIYIFDHTIRRQSTDITTKPEGEDPTQPRRGPVQRVHVDQTYQASLSRVPHHLPAEEAAELLKGRVEIINVWRAIKPAQRDPLAVADARSVAEEDLQPIGLIYPNRKGGTFSVKHSPQHRWYYKYGIGPEEALLIKCFDSKTDGRARRVPHSAFVDPSAAGPEIPARESIEVRCLVFHEFDRE